MIPETKDAGYIGKIPVRNIWLLLLYASDLLKMLKMPRYRADIEELPDDIPELVARILNQQVERRLKRNLSYGYQARQDRLHRVRGRIDMLQTKRHHLLERGMVSCRFNEMTVDTSRNRYVCAALEAISGIVGKMEIAHKCRSLAGSFRNLGVSPVNPGLAASFSDQFGRHDADDRYMVAAAKLAFNLALPTEATGSHELYQPDRDDTKFWELYEKAISGFYKFSLPDRGWKIYSQRQIEWPRQQESSGISDVFPVMKPDIRLDHKGTNRRIIIDTKSNAIYTHYYGKDRLRSPYIYQMYAYLRSQEEDRDEIWQKSEGILLHPSIGIEIDEWAVIQGHKIRFAAVDLSSESRRIQERLLNVILCSNV